MNKPAKKKSILKKAVKKISGVKKGITKSSKSPKPVTKPLTKTRSQMAKPTTAAQKAFMAPIRKDPNPAIAKAKGLKYTP